MKAISIGVAAALIAALVEAQPVGMRAGVTVGAAPAYGLGPGMPGYGIGAGMANRVAESYAGLELTGDQRRQIAEIQQAAVVAERQLLATVSGQPGRLYGPVDPAAVRRALFDLQVEARRRIDAVLTPEQREHLRRYWIRR